jgi:large subunit ribosomal protein L21
VEKNDTSRINEKKSVEMKQPRDIFNTVNRMISSPLLGRQFAVVHLGGSQHKITEEDVIVVNKLQAETGSRIILNKVLLAGTKYFTLIGRPLLPKELVTVEATVTEQTRTQRIIIFKKKRRKNYKRKRGHRQDITVLRINSITLQPNLK